MSIVWLNMMLRYRKWGSGLFALCDKLFLWTEAAHWETGLLNFRICLNTKSVDTKI